LKKTQTLRELIDLAFETFKIEGKEVTDCRLRAYDSLLRVRLGVFDQYDE